MYKKLLAYLLALGICCFSLVATAASNPADRFYEQGIEDLEALQRLTAERHADADELTRHLDSLDANMQRAAQLGHPAAALLEAQMRLQQRPKDPAAALDNRREGCNSLEALARKGFVAAAVLNFRKCDSAYLRFESSSPEHLAVMDALERSLHRQDPAMAYYPLPMQASQCFAIEPTQVNSLSHEQFRAEAEYILGSSRLPESRDAIEQNLRWLDAAFAHGCSATLDMRPMLRQELAKYS